jgi:Na+-transporting methylmalonyl-CoA/oxaloacetate decarboxylase beta subunit
MNLIEFFSTLGIFSITIGQSIMILVGLLLIYLAINKKFEPLLLLPIGFGALLTNIPEIGLSMSPIEKLIYANNPVEISTVVSELSISGLNLSEFLKNASFSEIQLLNIAAQNLGYSPGILYIFYETAIGSGIAPLLIFMGVGAMTEKRKSP